MDAAAIAAAAAKVLAGNDRGGYSVPTGGLYPMQFNWDSAFAALGYRFGEGGGERAWREVELLLDAQCDDGMVPHIVFRGDYHNYFPGPDVWRAGGDPPTSGITDPPVAAMSAAVLHKEHPLADKERYRRLLKSLAKWHRWMADVCLDENSGAFVAAHPWETGRDNLCDWDPAMWRINPRDHGKYVRSDTQIVVASQRPRKADYDRFLEIVAVGRECEWDQREFRKRTPFKMFDPGMTAVLACAADKLDSLLAEEGMNEELKMTAGIGARAREGMSFLWNDEINGYAAYDPVEQKHSDGLSAAAFLAPLAGLCEGERHRKLMKEFDRIASSPFALASYDPAHKGFTPKRYWRGPVWLPMNLLIVEGLRAAGEDARANRVVESSLQLVGKSGFYEYYDPLTGGGLGGEPFTWTASSALHFVNESDGN